MLQTIRDRTQGWIAGTIITIVILTFALWGIHSYFVGGSVNSDVAEVNGINITKEQLAVAYERLRRQVQIQYGSNNPITAKDETALKDRALQALINIEVLKQASLSQGFSVSDHQIDNYLRSMPEFQVEGQFSFERFQEILSSTLLSTSDFLEVIKTSLLIDQPRLGILLTSFVLPSDTRNTISLVNQERDFEYLNIPFQPFLANVVEISPEKIQAYYNDHKTDFMTPEQVSVEYIELSFKDLAAKINPTDAMLKIFYNENINAYSQSMQWKLVDLLIPISPTATEEEIQQLQNKANDIYQNAKHEPSFAQAIHQYPGSITRQTWLSLNDIPTDLQKIVSGLTKAGDISAPVRTTSGIVIVKAIDIQEPKMLTFENVKDKVREAYVRHHTEEKFTELRERLADLAYEHPDSLENVSKILNLPIKTSEFFTREKAGKDLSQYKKVRETAFSNDVLNLQNNSDVIQLTPEAVAVIRLKSHIASTLLPLNSISKQIEEKLKIQQAEVRTKKFAEELQIKLASGADPQQIAANNRLSWTKTDLVGRYSTKADPAILDLAFRLPNPDNINKKSTYGVIRLTNGYAIVRLKSVKEGSITDKKQNDVFAEQFQNSEGLLEYELYKLSQTKKSNIKLLS